MKYIVKQLPVNEKMEFFICTRDVKEGDIVWDTNHVLQPWGYLSGSDIRRIADHRFFRVIGEASKFATWLKDEDELERDDLLANGAGVNWNDKNSNQKFKIKGPCGHFH